MSIPSSTDRQREDSRWLAEALVLARRGMALAHPNPRVGAVIASGAEKVGEGFHVYDERDHAEIVALRQAGPKARGATIYVNLEPCCITGRTGQCTKAIIAAGIKRVVAAMEDPNPAVAGRGFAELRRAGIEVQMSSESDARSARQLNEDFAKWIRTRLPFVTMKSALTLDGKISARAGTTTNITGQAARETVQHIRHSADALLTGIGTVLADNPRLTDRSGERRRRRLLRVVLDSRLRLPLKSTLVKFAEGDVLVFTAQREDSRRARALSGAGIEIRRVASRKGGLDLSAILRELGKREILHLLVEAGAKLNGALLATGFVDKMILFYAPRIMGPQGVPLASISKRASEKLPALTNTLTNISLNACRPDFVVEGYFHDVYRDRGTRRKD